MGYSSPQCSFVVSSAAIQPSDPRCRTELKGVHQTSIRDVKNCFSEMELILSDLEAVARLHPNLGVAQYAQLILADIAGLVLRTWPADAAKSVKPSFQDLYLVEDGAFRKRWNREHITGRRKPGDSKRDLLHSLLFSSVWPLYQTSAFDVAQDLTGIRSIDFSQELSPVRYDLKFVNNLRSFYKIVPGLISAFERNPKEIIPLSFRALLLHFELFWKVVIDPQIFEGHPSL